MIYRRNIITINATQKQRNERYVVLAIYLQHFGENDVMKGVRKVGKIMIWGSASSREVETGKFWVLKFTVSRKIYVGIPGNFLHINKDFRGTDIHHSDKKKMR